jgi:hypothetical protein
VSEGRQRFVDTLRRILAAPEPPEMPKPSDQWGVWVDYRLDQLENHQTWMLRLLVGALAIQVGLRVLELLK